MTNEVTELLDALSDGTVTLEEVAQRFKNRRWPRRPRQEPTSYFELAAAQLRDPDPYLPGSFDDVIAAYDQKKITREQFRVLGEAVTEAERAEQADDNGPP